MDATQAIIFSDEESEEEQELGEKKAIAFLQILAQKDLSSSRHPIYEGDNFIGRHDSNSIHMPYKALSKQHACIEVQGSSHLIYDMESRNKTRRGKMFLKPNVRYELRDGDNLIFGDVKCQYILQTEEDDDETGSETDSDLMLRPPDSEDTGQDDKFGKEDENENDSSFNINDFLQPTQPCMQSPKLQFKTPQRLDGGKVFAADSDDDSPNKSNTNAFADDSFIPETQQSGRKKSDKSVLDESDSDTDIDETGPFDVNALTSAPTQAVGATQAFDNMETQAVSDVVTDVDAAATLAVDNMATQAVENMETQAVDNMATLAVDNAETQAMDNAPTLAVDNIATQAVDDMATLAVDSTETPAIDNADTQAIDNMATLAVDNMATQAVDGMATQAVDNLATLAVDYDGDSDSSDTDIDMVGQSLLEAPTQEVGFGDSSRRCTSHQSNQMLVLDSSTASSGSEDIPMKPARGRRNIYDEPTQICEGIVSDSGSDTDIEEGGMDAETQAVVITDGDNKIDDMATLAIAQGDSDDDDDDDVTEAGNKILGTDKTQEVENMATMPINTDDFGDDTDIEVDNGEGSNVDGAAKTDDAANMATVPIATDDADDADKTDVKEENKNQSAMKVGEMPDGITDAVEEDNPKLAPSNTDHADCSEMGSELDQVSQEYFLDYRAEPKTANTAETKPAESIPSDVEATQAYGGGPDDDDAARDTPGTNEPTIDATQPYGSPKEEAPQEFDTVAMSLTQPYGDEPAETKQSGSGDDGTDPTVPYGTAEDDVAMETGESEVECTQAYGMQGSDTQVPDSQEDGDEQANTSSRFPVFKTQSPSRSCLKQPNTPERKATKARRVTFGPTDEEDEDESDKEEEVAGRVPQQKQQRQQETGKKSSAPGQGPSARKSAAYERRSARKLADQSTKTSSASEAGTGKGVTKGLQKMEGDKMDNTSIQEADSSEGTSGLIGASIMGTKVEMEALQKKTEGAVSDSTSKYSGVQSRRTDRATAETDEVASSSPQKRKAEAIESVPSSDSTSSSESSLRGKRQRKGRVAEETDGDVVADMLTTTDAKPTRKKEFDEENPRPSRRSSKVKDERKMSDSSISSVSSEGSIAGKAVQTIVEIGKKITRISQRGRKKAGKNDEEVKRDDSTLDVARKTSQRLEADDGGESDDTASISSTASSLKDFAELEPSTRSTRGTRSHSNKRPDQSDGPALSGSRRSHRAAGKDSIAESQNGENNATGRNRKGKTAVDAQETELEGSSTQEGRGRARRGGAKDHMVMQEVSPTGNAKNSDEQIDSHKGVEFKSARTRRGMANTQEETSSKLRKEEPKPNAPTKATRGRAKVQSMDDSEKEDSTAQENKNSERTTSRGSRRMTGVIKDESPKETEAVNVRQSGRRRTMPAKFLDADDTVKATNKKQSSVKEAEDSPSIDAAMFAVPKAVGRSRLKHQTESTSLSSSSSSSSSSSAQNEVEVDTLKNPTRGKKTEESSEDNEPEPAPEVSKEISRRSKRTNTANQNISSKTEGDESTAPPVKRGRRSTRNTSESDEKAEAVKEVGRVTGRRGGKASSKQNTSSQEESAATESTPSQRGRRMAMQAKLDTEEKVKSGAAEEPAIEKTRRGRRVTSENQKPTEETSHTSIVTAPGPRGRKAAAEMKTTLEEPPMDMRAATAPTGTGQRGASEQQKSTQDQSSVASPSPRGKRATTEKKTDIEQRPLEIGALPVRGKRGASEKQKSAEETPSLAAPSPRGKRTVFEKETAAEETSLETSAAKAPAGRGKRGASEKQKSAEETSSAAAPSSRGKRTATEKQKAVDEKPSEVITAAAQTPRSRRAILSAAKASGDSKDATSKEQSVEDKRNAEMPKTRGKRAATATPPPSSPAKKPRQSTLAPPTSQLSPSASPTRRSRQQADQTAAAGSPSLRRRVSDVRPKVMFTGVMDESWQKTVTSLGGELVDSVHDCTHLVTDKVRRTVKFLCCMARGVIIITPTWLEESKTKKMFIDSAPYQLKDKASEKQHGFSLPASLQKAGQARLLKGYKIHVTPGVKPEPQQMKDIIKCAGGEFVAKLPTKSIPQLVVVSCEGDKSSWAGLSKAGIPIVSSEFILTGILRQEILLKEYKLK